MKKNKTRNIDEQLKKLLYKQLDETSLDDVGFSGQTFTVKSLTKGKIYEEKNPQYLSTKESGVVIDDNSCWFHYGTDAFNQRFKEIK